jgi:aldose 1-epimerase
MGVTGAPYGTTRAGQAVEQYTLSGSGGMTARIITYGGILTALEVPDRYGHVANVTLGLRDWHAYETENEPYFGTLVGRYANRIEGAKFTLDGRTYHLDANEPPASLHGGRQGYSFQVWKAETSDGVHGPSLRLSYHSPDGEGGYPGNVDVVAVYALTPECALRIDYSATSDRPTVINLTSHAYWNLRGEGTGNVDDHLLHINADRYTPTDAEQTPTGELAPVAGTPFDLRVARGLGMGERSDHPQIVLGRGYDHNWVLNRPSPADSSLIVAGRLYALASGRTMEVRTTEPGLQVYTANHLRGNLYGPSGHAYRQGDGVALETQHFPDSPNHPAFPSTELRPGQTFRSTTEFRFRTDVD